MATPRSAIKKSRPAATAVAAALATLTLLAGPGGARGQAPDEDWRTLETEHFRVTFPAELEGLGRRAAERAERAWVRLAADFVDPPGGRVDLLVTDHTDVSNGFARVTPSPRIVVYAPPPVEDPDLGYFDDWMELVVTHELAHVFHLDRTGTLGRMVRGLFGRVPTQWPAFPSRAVPRWTVEGLATWYESRLTDAGRVHGTFQETMLRTALLEGRFEELDQASGESPVWPSGNRSYAYGSLFFDHLLDKHGEDRMGAFAEAVAGQWVPYRLNAAGRDAFGASLGEEWGAWTGALEARWSGLDRELSRAGPITEPERLTTGARNARFARVSPDGETLAFLRSDGRSDAQLRVARPDGEEDRALARVNGSGSTFSWLPGGALLVGQLELADRYRIYGDLYRVGRDGGEERLTRGARLQHPSASPDGRWAAAVRSGGGTTALVRVELAGGEVRAIGVDDPDTHWAYPAVSPDGRWIAASRWRPGAHLDVVVVDLEGRVVLELTEDRAVDLAPSWSADGRWLVWASDRTGIQNVLAAEVDPAAGRAGPVLLATNVRTGVGWPSVDPAGRWLYFSGYHVDGWEVERAPFAPEAWRPAGPPVERFDAPPFEAARATAEAGGEVGGYSPFPTLRPRYWEPIYRAPRSTGAILNDELFLRSREVLGAAVGAETSGFDLVGRHSYRAFVRFRAEAERTDAGASWSWAGLGDPVLSLGLTQIWDENGPRIARQEEGAPLDTLFVLERNRRLSLSATFARPRARHVLSVTASTGLSWEDSRLLDNTLEPSTTYRLTRPSSRVGDASLSLSFSTVRSNAFQLGATNGVSLFVRGRKRTELSLPDSLSGVPGSDRALDEAIGQILLYRGFDGPGHAAHVLALRASGGYARGPDADAGHFDVGGAAGESEGISGLDLFGGRSLFFPLRGYPENIRFGRLAWSASAEYRFPLALVHQGLGAWPLYLDRVTGALFADAGNAWGPELGLQGFENPRRATLASLGGELVFQLHAFWTEPLRVRLGAAAPLVEGDGGRAYVRIGLAF